MISVTDLRAGKVFMENGNFFLVISYEHTKIGRGSGNVKVKVKNLTSGATVEKSYITGAKVQEGNMSRRKVTYLYKDGQGINLMDNESYDQFAIDEKLTGEGTKFLKEGMEVTLATVDGNPILVELPKIVDYKITQTGGNARGNTAGAAQKDAVLENGLVVKVPLFLKTGEVIRVDTRAGTYVERAK